jgi:hypothetical protein
MHARTDALLWESAPEDLASYKQSGILERIGPLGIFAAISCAAMKTKARKEICGICSAQPVQSRLRLP